MNNLLVTGGCGFIGANFIRYLLEESDFKGRVINVDKLTYAGNPLSLTDIEKRFGVRYVFVKEDICERRRMGEVLDRYQVDSICHFAAESHVDRSIASPDEFIRTNILGTHTLLELMRERAKTIALFHHISTDEVFGSLGADGFFTEDTPYRPNSPYSASKAASDHLVRAYHETYGLPVTISNCSNNYGPFQFPEKLIPLMILNAREGKPLPVYGDGLNVRDWLYVRDHCTAIWTIMKHGRRGSTYNVGGRNEMPNLEVVQLICGMVDELDDRLSSGGLRKGLIAFVKDRPGHDRRYAIDCSRMESTLGWKPEESFESGLRKTIRWYLENNEWVSQVRSGAYQAWIQAHYG
ncbi:MAG TPA: dTDP-glucose 4,6-dehydratase [Verrucomicrobia bacterium]|nr:MAG: dTDP-glucose 4,6-dehydratase [Lentisphaerae bacterium GWF2_57_35]HBA82461.1 dTDP-glucose 4,6-dehydratase [Verrucomicrobiota bacterium]